MSRKPLVSVVMPILNAERFLEEAIQSVFAQSYDHWELLLVDDGSIDNSTRIAQKYAAQYPEKVRYFEHEGHRNRGKSTSRNLGISSARGEYIAFLDADDVWLPQKLQQQVTILKALPEAAMVYGPTYYWYGWTGSPPDIRRDFVARLGVHPNTLFDPPALLTHFLKDGGIVPCTCGLLARHKIIEAVGGFEESIAHLYEDQVLLAKICLKAPVFVEDGCWDRYRQHPDSSSHIAIRSGAYHPSKPNPARQAFLSWLAEYVSSQGIGNTELQKALQKALWPYCHPVLFKLLEFRRRSIRKAKTFLPNQKR